MAEGICRRLLQDDWVESAGLYPGAIHEMTLEVMQEIGIDLAAHHSKKLEELSKPFYDTLIVLAEPALGPSQKIQAKERLYWAFPDPAKTVGDRETIKAAIRLVRDQLQEKIENFLHEKSL